MKQFRISLALTTILFLACSLTFIAPVQATMIGDEIFASGTSLNPDSAVIGDGVEFTGIIDYLQFDFDEGTLTISDGNLVGWSGFQDYVFSGFDDTITGLSIASNTGFTGQIVDNFSFTEDSITLDMSFGGRFIDSVLVFDIETASVPEPATMLLLATGLVGIAGFGRRKIYS